MDIPKSSSYAATVAIGGSCSLKLKLSWHMPWLLRRPLSSQKLLKASWTIMNQTHFNRDITWYHYDITSRWKWWNLESVPFTSLHCHSMQTSSLTSLTASHPGRRSTAGSWSWSRKHLCGQRGSDGVGSGADCADAMVDLGLIRGFNPDFIPFSCGCVRFWVCKAEVSWEVGWIRNVDSLVWSLLQGPLRILRLGELLWSLHKVQPARTL